MEGTTPRAQTSWVSGSSGEVSLGHKSRLGPPTVFGALAFVVAVDLAIVFAVVVVAAIFEVTHGMGVDGRIACSSSVRFCYDDPVPDIDVSRLAMIIIGAGLIASMIVAIAVRRGIIVVLLCQGLLLAITLTQGLSVLHGAEHRQNELRACHYGTAGHCRGILNLD